jgi:hypoxanthine phosphoribosyltransferase
MQDCSELLYFWQMKPLQILDRFFIPFISEAAISARIKDLAIQMTSDFDGKNPVFIGILNGSFMFCSDLLRLVNIPCEISFMKCSSYQGTSSTGVVKQLFGLHQDIKGRNIVLIEDIIDTGYTMEFILKELSKEEPASIKICTLLFKPDALKAPIKADYIGFETENKFLLGYGLDYNGYGRNLPEIYVEVSH